MTSRKLFVNIPVHDLKRAMTFFSGLGFEFNPKFTDDKAACMVVSDESFFMLLTEPFFDGFLKRPRSDPKSGTQALYAISAASRAEVDSLTEKALASGGSKAGDTQDHGFMYGRSFFDPDGHHWEVIWMDPGAAAH
jgi:predicted lactoylglutathione lyase